METFEAFLKQIENESHREKLAEIFKWIETNYPFLDKEIKWKQPMYINNGTFIIGFSTAKAHISVASEKDGLKKFKDAITGSGYSSTEMLFRIKWTEETNFDLLKQIIDYNIEDKADCDTFWRK